MYNIIAEHVVRHHLNGDQERNTEEEERARARMTERQNDRSLPIKMPKNNEPSWNLFGAGYLLITLKANEIWWAQND